MLKAVTDYDRENGHQNFPIFSLAGWVKLGLTPLKKNKRPVSALVPWAGLITPMAPLFLDNVLGVLIDQDTEKYFVSRVFKGFYVDILRMSTPTFPMTPH